MRKNSARLMLAILVFLPVLRVAASEVTLKNGDRISGTIIAETESVIVLETEYAGRVTIDRQHIDSIADGPDAAASGPKASDEAPIVVASAPRAADKPKAEAKPEPAPPEKSRLFDGPFLGLIDGWEGSANIGFSFTSGNSNNSTMTTGVSAVKRGVGDNLTVYARSLWNSTHGNGKLETTQNAFWGGARYERNVDGGRIFGFVSYDFESDRPRHLNFRSVVGSGVGHHAVKRERTEVDLRAGGAWNRTWQTGENTDTPEALAGATLKHKFNDRLRLQKAFTWFQNVADAGEYRYIFDATLSVDVTKRIGFYFSAGDRFNNDPLGVAQKNDFLFTTGMKWSFGSRKK
jgi:putative salt-induced outer membrane protein YdiY